MAYRRDELHVRDDGFIVVKATGEVLGMQGVRPDFRITDRDGATWLLKKYARIDGAIAGHEIALAAAISEHEALIRQQLRARQWLDRRFGQDMAELVEREIGAREPGKTEPRSIKTGYGRYGYRMSKRRLVVRDLEGALAWLLANRPEATKPGVPSIVMKELAADDFTLPPAYFESRGGEDVFFLDSNVANQAKKKGANDGEQDGGDDEAEASADDR